VLGLILFKLMAVLSKFLYNMHEVALEPPLFSCMLSEGFGCRTKG
jgi:hypothetical protein